MVRHTYVSEQAIDTAGGFAEDRTRVSRPGGDSEAEDVLDRMVFEYARVLHHPNRTARGRGGARRRLPLAA